MGSSGVQVSGGVRETLRGPASTEAEPARDGKRGTARSPGQTAVPASLGGLPERVPTNVNVIWTGGRENSPVPYNDIPSNRSAVFFAPPLNRSLNASQLGLPVKAAFHTDMSGVRYDRQTLQVLPSCGEISPTLQPPVATRTPFDEIFKRHPDNRAMALLDWARSAAYNPGHFSDIMRVAVQLSDLLDHERDCAGQGQTHYLDIDDMDNFRRLTQGGANKIVRVPDTDAIGGVRPDFEGLPVRAMSGVLRLEGLIGNTSELEAIAAYGVKAAVLLGLSLEKAFETYDINSPLCTTKEDATREITALLTTPEARVFLDPSSPRHLPTLYRLADELGAKDEHTPGAVTPEARADAKMHVTRAMILGPFLDALRAGTKFESAAEQCGLDVQVFGATMLAVAKRARIKDLPKLAIPEKSVAVWRYGTIDKLEVQTDYVSHLRELKDRFQTDLSPEAQRSHMLEHFTKPAHRPGLRAWKKNEERPGMPLDQSARGWQNTMSAVGIEGVASLEAVAYRMARNVFERHLPGNVASPSDARGDKPKRQAWHEQVLERFDEIYKTSPVDLIRVKLELYILEMRQGVSNSTAEWARISRAWLATRDKRVAHAYTLARQDVMQAAPDAVGEERRQLLEEAYKSRFNKVSAHEKQQQMMSRNWLRGILDDTGPSFYEGYAGEADESIPNKVQPTTEEMEQIIGNLFGVDAEKVKSHLAEHDQSWRRT